MRTPLIGTTRPLATSAKRALEPGERIAEVLFGLIMVLSFTGSLSVADAGRDDVRTMLIGALGCNIAWGIIDGILYLMDCLSRRRVPGCPRPTGWAGSRYSCGCL